METTVTAIITPKESEILEKTIANELSSDEENDKITRALLEAALTYIPGSTS